MFPWNLYPVMFYPILPTDNDRPPTLYAILNSIVNYGNDDQVKIKNLTTEGRSKIFDFYYPLSSKVNKEQFEINILNHFLMRRLGYPTFTSWQIALNSKLNEIMPKYNKILDALSEWDILNDGEIMERTSDTSNTDNTVSQNSMTTESSGENVSDQRYSDVPENKIQDVQSGEYVTNYSYNTDTSESTVESNGNNTTDSTGTQNVVENIRRSPADKINIYKQYLQEVDSVYSMIYKDLDSLFYQLV